MDAPVLGNADDETVYSESDEEEGYVYCLLAETFCEMFCSLLLVFALEKLLDRKVFSVNSKDLCYQGADSAVKTLEQLRKVCQRDIWAAQYDFFADVFPI